MTIPETVRLTGRILQLTEDSALLARQLGGADLPWDPERLSEVTLWSVPLWGFLHRCAQQPEEFLYQRISLPSVPVPVVQAAGLLSAALWLYLAYVLAAWKMKGVRGFALIGAAYALWTVWGAGIEASGWSLVLRAAGAPLYWWARSGNQPAG